MGDNAQVAELVSRLRRLQLEQQEVLLALNQAIQQANQTQERRDTAVPPDHIPPEDRPGFVVGDSVYITNRLRHIPLRRLPTLRDRAAIITSMSGTRIYLRTYNGYDTWRIISNIRKLTRQERDRIEAS